MIERTEASARPAEPAPASALPVALPELDALLPTAKARLARRLVLEGKRPEPADFAARALALSKPEAARLAAWEETALTTRVAERVPSDDGSARLVVKLRDGELIETVAMPVGAVCVSTQVGCAVACRFCASGMNGLKRNLAAAEIVEQVIHARRERRIDRVVYMGMGEPSHNLANVLEAVALLKSSAGIGPARQTFSTVGSAKAFAGLSAARVKPCLALSLHSADDAIRRELLPNAAPEPVAELVAGAARYAALQKKPIVFEWTLLAGVNDRDEDVAQLAALLKGVRGYVNFIRWNPVAGMPFTPTSFERAVELREQVKAHGILATIRASTGRDVDAACGQLRRRSTISTLATPPRTSSTATGSDGK
ncbi:MAG: radical SAM protein [Planctomycetes bacterium]|nr:radical SAM protein [Planctomycetota bacterium]